MPTERCLSDLLSNTIGDRIVKTLNIFLICQVTGIPAYPR